VDPHFSARVFDRARNGKRLLQAATKLREFAFAAIEEAARLK
jgi:hypothetical protein